jgi:K+-transporting ATPase ATPase C chain
MTKQLRTALLTFVILTVITGVVYPLVVTLVAQVAFPYQANGSLIERDGQIIGSALIGQGTSDRAYFWSRPSAVNYMLGTAPDALGASGGSNAGWTNRALAEAAAERAAAIRAAHDLAGDAPIPADLLFASGSGLDPHISPEAARLQMARVAETRGLRLESVSQLVDQFTEAPQVGVFGQPRVNVLLLNLALDELQSMQGG